MQLLGAIVADYKSVTLAEVPLEGLTVLFGPNGVGKTNLIEAIGTHDPLVQQALRRSEGQEQQRKARVGLVTRLAATRNGGGPDAKTLCDMLTAPWRTGMAPSEITEGVGVYCSSCWWLDGGHLYNPADQESLSAVYAVIRRYLTAKVEPDALDAATRMLDLLLDEPVLIVQEDFAVYLSCDRQAPAGRELLELGRELNGRLGDGALDDVVGTLGSWTGRWPPLTTFSRGPGNGATAVPPGFDWVVGRFGGVRAVIGDAETVEAHLDTALEQVHDRLLHHPKRLEDFDDEPQDAFCEHCLHPDHGGRVPLGTYTSSNDATDGELPFPYPGTSGWLEERDGWARVRPSLQRALTIVEQETNRRLPTFVADQGTVRLEIRPVPEWGASPARCRVLLDLTPGSGDRLLADWDGKVGVIGFPVPPGRGGVLRVPLADLGAGLRRWVTIAVRLAVEACAMGDVDLLPDRRSAPGTLARGKAMRVAVQRNIELPRILLIDEPEQHLHPAAQHEIAVWCLQQAQQHHAVLVATHSPAFFALPPQQVTACQVVRRNATTIVRPLPSVHGVDAVNRARELGFELGLGRDALAQLTRAVVVVEGEWDRRILHAFFGDQLAEQRVLVVPLQGSDELHSLADAAVIPALGLPVIALLDDIRAADAAELDRRSPPLSKAERGLRDLRDALGESLRFVRYPHPDIICALPEEGVRSAFPNARFPGWDVLLDQWREAQASGATADPFKKWALNMMGLRGKQRLPGVFCGAVLNAAGPAARPHRLLCEAVEQLLGLVDDQRPGSA